MAGRKYNAKVKDGVAKVKLRTFAKPGKYKVVVQFRANDTFLGATETVHDPRQALIPASGGPVRRAPTAAPPRPRTSRHPPHHSHSETSCPHVPPSGAARLLVGLAVAATSLVAIPLTATANPAGTGLVISEVYGGGGNAGATYTNDFIELYNPTDARDQRRREVGPVPLAPPAPPASRSRR